MPIVGCTRLSACVSGRRGCLDPVAIRDSQWNLNIFAHQGYFVVAINLTGSTTFSQDLVDAITKDWGGKPFIDLQKYALEKYPKIDPDCAVVAGASWGGYAIK
ncbi:hypothetical protein EDB85DRAFT_1900380 [Lactarius pseudohatsudake]|nr:hypothetical protein EDB85DRAFT_1900380 [Lactarius pseudohatsudake]